MENGNQADFAKHENEGRPAGFFTETGILNMLEGKDCKSISHVAPFFEETVVVCCKSSKTVLVIGVPTQYADPVLAIRNSDSHPGWLQRKLSCLQQQIFRFKGRALDVFRQHQATNTETFQ